MDGVKSSVQSVTDNISIGFAHAAASANNAIGSIKTMMGELGQVSLAEVQDKISKAFKEAADNAIADLNRINQKLNELDGRVVTVTVKIVEKKG